MGDSTSVGDGGLGGRLAEVSARWMDCGGGTDQSPRCAPITSSWTVAVPLSTMPNARAAACERSNMRPMT